MKLYEANALEGVDVNIGEVFDAEEVQVVKIHDSELGHPWRLG